MQMRRALWAGGTLNMSVDDGPELPDWEALEVTMETVA